tara:strand:- start:164 stop:511 length:348 start_codon:yes stop_codon:yes gene_type:complete
MSYKKAIDKHFKKRQEQDWDKEYRAKLTIEDDQVMVKVDNVNSPPHYREGFIECIDAIQASMSDEEFKGYCKGNVLKYIWRYNYKGKAFEDISKSEYYLKKLKSLIKETNAKGKT